MFGRVEKDGEKTAFLTKDPEKNQVTVTPGPAPGAKTIVTRYRVLEQGTRCSLLEVELITGRTIRSGPIWLFWATAGGGHKVRL